MKFNDLKIGPRLGVLIGALSALLVVIGILDFNRRALARGPAADLHWPRASVSNRNRVERPPLDACPRHAR